MQIRLDMGSANALMRLTIPITRRGLVFGTAAFLLCSAAAAQQFTGTLVSSNWAIVQGAPPARFNCDHATQVAGNGQGSTVTVPVQAGFDDSSATNPNACDTITGAITVQVATPPEPFAVTEQATPSSSPFFGQPNASAQFTLAQSYTVTITADLTYTVASGGRGLGLSNNPVFASVRYADNICAIEIQPPSSSGPATGTKSC